VYKYQLDNAEESKDATDSSFADSEPRNIFQDKKQRLYKKCLDCMGEGVFEEVYQFFRSHREAGTSDEVISQQAKARWGKQATTYCLLVEQLIFLDYFSN